MKHYHILIGLFLVLFLCLISHAVADSTAVSDANEFLLLGMEGPPLHAWTTCIGGSKVEVGHSVQQTTDGGYVVTGYTDSSDGDMSGAGYYSNTDAFLAKYTSTGTRVWVTCIGGSGSDYGNSVQQTTDGGFVVAGHTSSSDSDMTGAGFHGGDDAFLAKYTSTGTRVWVACIGGSGTDYGNSVQQTTDGGYVVTGFTYSSDGNMTGAGYHSNADVFLAKYTSTGTLVWVTCTGGSGYDYGESLQQTTDGGYIIAGFTTSSDGDMTGAGFHGGDDAFLAKYTSTGTLVWVTCIGGSNNDQGYSVQQTTDGGYIIAGYTTSSNGDMTGAGYHGDGSYYDAFLAKYTSTGIRSWVTCIGGSDHDYGYSVQQTTDGGYVAAGHTSSSNGDMTGAGFHGGYDAFLAKYTSTGVRLWVTCIGGSYYDYGYSVQQTTDDGYVVTGSTYSSDGDMAGAGYHASTDAFLAKVSAPTYKPPAEIGVFRGAGQWFLDRNGNHAWDGAVIDAAGAFGKTGDLPAVTDWNNNNVPEIGIFRDGQWYVDFSGNYHWDGTRIDRMFTFGQAGDIPVIVDWNRDLDPDIGVFRAAKWYLDQNGNHHWDGTSPGLDGVYTFGIAGDTPVIGDWDRDGHPEIGVFRAGKFYMDYNRNYAWDGSVIDRVYSFGLPGDRPVTGDWNGDGIMEIGVFRAAKWYVDMNGNNCWDGTGTGKDAIYTFGLSDDRPVTGEWT